MQFPRMPWQHNLGPIGLDLGADAPHAMQVRLGVDAPTAHCAARVETSPALIDRTRAAIHALRCAGFVGREVVVGLSSSCASMHVARFPTLESDDHREAVAWEAAERSAIPRESIVADSLATLAPSSGTDSKSEYLVVSANATELTDALDLLIESGFEPIAVEPRFASIARALARRVRRDADSNHIRAVLHVERAGSTVLVLRGDRVAFCREITLGGGALDQAVAARLSISVEAAAVLRDRRIAYARGVAPTIDPIAEEAALAATRPTIDAIANELALCLRYFGVTFRGGQPTRVILSGPHGAEPRLAGIIEETCRANVSSFETELPSAAVELTGGSCETPAAYLAAYGLSCRGRAVLAKEVAA